MTNWTDLFSSPSDCECKDCQNVFSPAAYLTDIMEYLDYRQKNGNGDSPLQVLFKRRPDIGNLPLTCENTNTEIPYIDLVNEIMEYYVLNYNRQNKSLPAPTVPPDSALARDTGDVTAGELKAEPQNTLIDAYSAIYSQAVYPFNLPYHQPLDVIRLYLGFLKTSRAELLEVFNVIDNTKAPPTTLPAAAVDSESMQLSLMEYEILLTHKDASGKFVTQDFSGNAVTPKTNVEDYFGVQKSTYLGHGIRVADLLLRTGLEYTELLAILETKFINPGQDALNVLQTLLGQAQPLDPQTLYKELKNDAWQADSNFSGALSNNGITNPTFFATWFTNNFLNFQHAITLYESTSDCDLDKTLLHSIQCIYETSPVDDPNPAPDGGITDDFLSRLHRFIRLWRKTGWTVHELDNMIAALGETDITSSLIHDLAVIGKVNAILKLPVLQLACLWGDIDTYGDNSVNFPGNKSLYAQLFLKRTGNVTPSATNVFAINALSQIFSGTASLLKDHLPEIYAALGISSDDYNSIIADAQINGRTGTISLPNLSAIYRYKLLADALGLSIGDLCILKSKCFKIDPFKTADDCFDFVQKTQKVQKSGFSVAVLSYILSGSFRDADNVALPDTKIVTALPDLRNTLALVAGPNAESSQESLLVSTISTLLDSDVPTIRQIVGDDASTLVADIFSPPIGLSASYYGNTQFAEPAALQRTDANIDFDWGTNAPDPNVPANKFSVRWEGWICPPSNGDYAFTVKVSETDESATLWIDGKQVLTTGGATSGKGVVSLTGTKMYPIVVEYVETTGNAAVHLLWQSAAMPQAPVESKYLFAQSFGGLSASYYNNTKFAEPPPPALQRTDANIDFDWGTNAPDPNVPADKFSVRWKGWICPPADGDYTFTINVSETDESAALSIDGKQVLATNGATSGQGVVSLTGAKMYPIVVEYVETTGNAAIHLLWQSATMPQTPVDPKYLFADTNVNDVLQKLHLYDRAVQFIAGFKLSAAEVGYLSENGQDFGKINFLPVTSDQWLRIYDYTTLRALIPANLLLSLFQKASIENAADPQAFPSNALISAIASANITGWSADSLSLLGGNNGDNSLNPQVPKTKSYFGYKAGDFKNEIALLQIKKAMDLAIKTKMSVDSSGLSAWAFIETDPASTNEFNSLHAIAEQVKNVINGKHKGDWLAIATQLNNRLREHQKDSLIGYLTNIGLTLPEPNGQPVTDADTVYEYLLIDVQMTATVMTSRLIQATMAVQLFASRCLLGLETDVVPGAIDPDEWDWMKHYSVAAGLKKLFVYVENYLDPSLRDDKSPFFLDFESAIKKGDITAENVENAFRDYLQKLNEVSNMELCGMYNDMETGTLYVFGRTHAAPYNYYFRTASAGAQFNSWTWSPWEQIQLDIKSIDDGQDSGVHLMPVVWKKRLFLFWPEFTEKTAKLAGTSQTYSSMADTSPDKNTPQKYWEVRLAWSEYANAKWFPKKVSKEVLTPLLASDGKEDLDVMAPIKPRQYSFRTTIDGQTGELTIGLYLRFYLQTTDPGIQQQSYCYDAIPIGAWQFSDIHEQITPPNETLISYDPSGAGYFVASTTVAFYIDYMYRWNRDSLFSADLSEFYEPFFQSIEEQNKLTLSVYDILLNTLDHKLSFSNDMTIPDMEDNWEYPFFYRDETNRKAFFVAPTHVYPLPKVTIIFPWPTYTFIGQFAEPANAHLKIFNRAALTPLSSPKAIPIPDPEPDLPAGTVAKPLTGPAAFTPEASTAVSNAFSPARPPAINYFDNSAGNISNIGMVVADGGRGQSGAPLVADPMSFEGNHEITADSLTGYAFYTFYHPFASILLKKLNEKGVAGLLAANTTEFPKDCQYPNIDTSPTRIANDQGNTFVANCKPHFEVVQQYDPNDQTRNYYLENVDFSEYGTYSCYNWELFFHAPFLIATTLSKNGKYAEAREWFHYIFNPLSTESPDPKNPNSPFWKVLPFKMASSSQDFTSFIENLQSGYEDNKEIDDWRKDPFNAFLMARGRQITFMKNVVMRYVDNLINWGDDLFRTYTRENINEATQLYVLAARILGPTPQFIPQRGATQNYSYNDLKSLGLDDFGDAVVQLQNAFPNSSDIQQTSNSVPQNLLGIGRTLYFCIPPNDHLLQYWSKVGDRLFKIRHGENIDGVVIPLALYEPPIDPELLLQAKAQGLDVAAILADLERPAPIYRFTYLIQKAREFCNEVVSLGSALLAANEKQDAEGLSRLRQTQEIGMLNMVTEVKTRQVLEAQANLDNLNSNRATAIQRLSHYVDQLLGNPPVQVPDLPVLPDDLDADSSLPQETIVNQVTSSIDVSLTGTAESGVKVVPREKQEMDDSQTAFEVQAGAASGEALAGILHLFPTIEAKVTPWGIGVGSDFGGPQLGDAVSALARVAQIISSGFSHSASQAARTAGFIRREQDWVFQGNIAVREIVQLDRQIIAGQIRLQMAQHELTNHKQQIQNAQDIEQFFETKFTKQELYQWMVDKLQDIHKQGYQLAYDMARKAEKAYRFEIGDPDTDFVQYGYFNDAYLGITAGEQLQLSLKQMEAAYIENNEREYELTKSVSLAQVDPLALLQLKETGLCTIDLREELFDMDYPGHYFRRIKSLSVSIPCVAGPYSTVNATLRLLDNSIRIDTNTASSYSPGDPNSFIKNNTPRAVIATSSAQNDSGMFELNFRDERYLPFEGVGAISTWQLELNGKYVDDKGTITDFSQFDHETISDVIIHLKYTSREDAGVFRDSAIANLKTFIPKNFFTRLFSAKHEFPNEWYKFLNPSDTAPRQSMQIALTIERFPYQYRGKEITVSSVDLFLKFKDLHDKTFQRDGTPFGDYAGGAALTVSLQPPIGSAADAKLASASTLLNGLPFAAISFTTGTPPWLGTWTLTANNNNIAKIAHSLQNIITTGGTTYNHLNRAVIDDILMVYYYSAK